MEKYKDDNDLFFLCGLIEHMGRTLKRKRKDIVNALGEEELRHIYNYADVLHCENIDEVAYRYIEKYDIQTGKFDNITTCEFRVPTNWNIGRVYQRLIQDMGGEKIERLIEVYNSWIAEKLDNYNIAVYFLSPEYICECYKAGEILD